MPWWAWVVVVAVIAAVLTRKWNPISRASAADTLGRRWWLLVHFWPVWRWVVVAGVAGVAILLAARPGPHEAPAPARAAKPAPTTAAPTHAASPTASPVASHPAATSSPVAVPGGEGHFPGPIFLVLLIAVGMGAALTVWSLRRRDDPDRWLAMAGPDLLDDETSDDADGWPPGSGPGRTNTDTEDDDDDTDGGYDLGPVVGAAEETDHGYTTGRGGGGVVGAGAVRGVSHRGRRLPRRR